MLHATTLLVPCSLRGFLMNLAAIIIYVYSFIEWRILKNFFYFVGNFHCEFCRCRHEFYLCIWFRKNLSYYINSIPFGGCFSFRTYTHTAAITFCGSTAYVCCRSRSATLSLSCSTALAHPALSKVLILTVLAKSYPSSASIGIWTSIPLLNRIVLSKADCTRRRLL